MLSYDNQNLDKEEMERENYISTLTWPSLNEQELKKERQRLREFTIVQKPEKKSISIRLLANDLIKVKAQAERMGVPYQTLIAMEVHKIANRDHYKYA